MAGLENSAPSEFSEVQRSSYRSCLSAVEAGQNRPARSRSRALVHPRMPRYLCASFVKPKTVESVFALKGSTEGGHARRRPAEGGACTVGLETSTPVAK